jgi:hypothetical protein
MKAANSERECAMSVKLGALALAGLMAAAGTVEAAPLDYATAKKELFSPKGLVLEAADLTVFPPKLKAHYESVTTGAGARTFIAQAQASGVSYYGAIAVPRESAPSLETLTIGGNAHSPDAAAKVVLAQCETAAGEACAVVAYLMPEHYEARDFTLSASATAAFDKNFERGTAAYLAYSPSTAAFSLVKGAGGGDLAVESCNKNAAGAGDCVVGVAEE